VTRDEIRAQVLAALAVVVPELDPGELRPDRLLRDELDIDSMDFLNFTIGLHKAFGVEIPEQDYRQLATLDACIDYVAAALAARDASPQPR
jgi:acyl carrier protein